MLNTFENCAQTARSYFIVPDEPALAVQDLDKDTVVEAIVEIAAPGHYVLEAEELLFEELCSFGYGPCDAVRIVRFCESISTLGEPRVIGRALYQLLLEPKALKGFLDSDCLAVACLMLSH